MNEDENGARKKFRLLYSFRKICKGGWDDGLIDLLCSRTPHTGPYRITPLGAVLGACAQLEINQPVI